MNVIRFRWREPERDASRRAIGFSSPDGQADWLRRELHWVSQEVDCTEDANVFVEYEDDEVWVVAEMSDVVFEVFAPKVT